jgi:hypothetical protein
VFRQIILPDLAVLRVAAYEEGTCTQNPVFQFRKFLGLPDPDPLVGGTDPHPSIFQRNLVRKTSISTVL